MRKFILLLCALLVLGVAVPTASAGPVVPVVLSDWGFYIDGGVTQNPDIPSNFTSHGWDWTTGLGTFSLDLSAGPHDVVVYFNHLLSGNTYLWDSNVGDAVGTPATDQSWMIGDPAGMCSGTDMFSCPVLFAGPPLPNLTSPFGPNGANGIGWAMGGSIGNTGNPMSLYITVSRSKPTGFYLELAGMVDPANGAWVDPIYFSGTVNNNQPTVPEPGSMLLLGTGLVGLVRAARRRK